MHLEVKNISVEPNCLVPTLRILLDVTYHYQVEAPLTIGGQLLAEDGKVIGSLHELQSARESDLHLKPLEKSSRDARFSDPKFRQVYQAYISCELSAKSIHHIELLRSNNAEKSVILNGNFIIKSAYMPSALADIEQSGNHAALLQVNVKRMYSQYTIGQSEWVQQYAGILGLGDYLLLEMVLPDIDRVPIHWQELFQRSVERIKEMKKAILHHDWQQVMFKARQFFENLKFNIQHTPQRQFKDELKQLFEKQQYSPEGFEDLYTGITAFFNYASKFIHDKDRQGQLNPVPLPGREDANFVYALSIGLLDILVQKVKT